MTDFYKFVIPDKMHEKLSEAVIAMMATGNLPYYGEFALFINFYESKNNPYIPTAGVNVTSAGMNFYWDRKFIDSLPQPEINFLLIHEEFHILFDHIKRSVGYDLKAANIVQDMIINQIIHDEIMKNQGLGTGDKPFISIPKDELGNNSALMVPNEYKGEQIFEDLYEWYVAKRREWQEKNKEKIKDLKNKSNKCSKCGSSMDKPQDGNEENDEGQGQKGEGQGEGGEGESGDGSNTCPNCGHENKNNQSRQGKKDMSGKDRYGNYGKNNTDCYSLDTIFEGEERQEQNTLDAHLGDDIPQELKREIVDGVMSRLKNRGLESGDVDAILNKLRKSKKDYLKEIKRAMSSQVFGSKKEKTIVRPNRKGISGMKGHKKFKNEINVLLDTSGSMGGDFERVLAYVFQNDIQMNLIQCDAQIQKVLKIKDKKDLEKMKISGLGGTTLMPAIDYISDPKNKLYMLNTVILTDGYTDSLDFRKIKSRTLILSTAEKCPITYDNGRVKQIVNIGKQD